jgi:diguanylate cyclase (GGDEF)-like protein
MVRLEQEWESAQRHHQPISVLMLDLDYFKSVNDTLGHDSGDMVLVHAAKLMKSTARTTDIVCRFGGEEFLVIASNTDGNSAKLLAERMRIAIQFNQPANIALPRPLTVSIGVSGTIDSEQSWKELIKMADRALYQVKANGRNATKLALF